MVKTPSNEYLDLEYKPGTVLSETLMRDVLDPFETSEGKVVPAFEKPRNYLSVNPEILSGYPVISGSRVPFDAVAGLADEGVEPIEIVTIYPSVDPKSIPDAQDFAQAVAQVA